MMESSRKQGGRNQRAIGRRGALAALLVLATVLSASTAAAGASVSRSAGVTRSLVKACGYMISSGGGATVEFVRIADAAAAGARGTFLFRGPGASETKQLVLNTKGLALMSFPVTRAGTETIAVTLATRPATRGTFHFTLDPVASDVAAQQGCTPR